MVSGVSHPPPKPEKRKGGRPKGTTGIPLRKGARVEVTHTKEMAREALRQIVLREMESMAAAQITHAKGLNYLVGRDRVGKFKRLTSDEADLALAEGGESQYTMIEVWQKDPSVQAFTDLLNRALDKPADQKQEIEITGSADLIARLMSARSRNP